MIARNFTTFHHQLNIAQCLNIQARVTVHNKDIGIFTGFHIKENDLTQEAAADIMGVQRSRVGDVCRGKMSGFSIDALVARAARAGLHPIHIAEK